RCAATRRATGPRTADGAGLGGPGRGAGHPRAARPPTDDRPLRGSSPPARLGGRAGRPLAPTRAGWTLPAAGPSAPNCLDAGLSVAAALSHGCGAAGSGDGMDEPPPERGLESHEETRSGSSERRGGVLAVPAGAPGLGTLAVNAVEGQPDDP